MTSRSDDPLLDSLLEEVLGHRSPPDLTARIIAAWQLERQQAPNSGNGQPPLPTGGPSDDPPVAPPIQVPPRQEIVIQDSGPRRSAQQVSASRHQRRSLVLVASVLLATAVGAVSWYHMQSAATPQPLASPRQSPPPSPLHDTEHKSPTVEVAQDVSRERPLVQPQALGSGPLLPHDSATLPADDTDEQLTATLPPASATRLPADEVVQLIDTALARVWQEHEITPSPPATDAQWCRRAYLRLLGRIPTVEEVTQFTGDPSPDKRQRLLQRLLDDPHYATEYATNWSEIWANILVGRRAGTRPADLAYRDGLLQYLRRSLYGNKPFDRWAMELVSATGANRPTDENFNGAANFLLADLDPHGLRATTRTARVFLGKQLDCVQCHDHPLNDWQQQEFWELNAFFRQMHGEREAQTNIVRLVNRDFVGQAGDGQEAEVYYEQLSGLLRVAYPALDGQLASRSGLVADVDRRAELAERLAQSPQLAPAAVNRMWSLLLGYGFTRPVDDMGPHNPASHPQLLAALAGQFAAHGYDLKQLTQWIMLSEAFGRSSRIGSGNLADLPEAGEGPLFSRYYTRYLQPEEVYQSLSLVAQARSGDSELGTQSTQAARRQWVEQFVRELETDEGGEITGFAGDLHQSLTMMNGPLMQAATSMQPGSLLHRVATSDMSDQQKIEHLFMAAVARKPNGQESTLAEKLLKDAQAHPETALQDIWWALLNSNEFVLDH